jgi:hypothetical protein
MPIPLKQEEDSKNIRKLAMVLILHYGFGVYKCCSYQCSRPINAAHPELPQSFVNHVVEIAERSQPSPELGASGVQASVICRPSARVEGSLEMDPCAEQKLLEVFEGVGLTDGVEVKL